MKTKIILTVFLCLFLLNFQNGFAWQITKVDNTQTSGGNPSTIQFIEFFNDSENDLNIEGFKIFDSGAIKSGHSISTSSKAENYIIPAKSYFIIAYNPTNKFLENINCKIFKSAIKIGSTDDVLFKKDTDSIFIHLDSPNTITEVNCASISNSSSTTTSSSTQSSSSTEEKVTTKTVYVYIAQNNQNKYGDIQVLLPEEKIVPALADVEYTVKAIDSQKKAITGLDFNWSFGDGGEKFGKDTTYHYTYPGEYTLIATADGFTSSAQAKMNVKVITPNIKIIKVGENENYIDIENNSSFDLFLSNFYLNIDNQFYKLPKNLSIAKNKTVHISGEAVGFKLPAINISLHYPNKNLLTKYESKLEIATNTLELVTVSSSSPILNTSTESIKLLDEKVLDLRNNFIKNIILKPKINNKIEKNIQKINNTDYDTKNSIVYLNKLIFSKVEKSSKNIGKTFEKEEKESKNVDIGIVKWIKSLIY